MIKELEKEIEEAYAHLERCRRGAYGEFNDDISDERWKKAMEMVRKIAEEIGQDFIVPIIEFLDTDVNFEWEINKTKVVISLSQFLENSVSVYLKGPHNDQSGSVSKDLIFAWIVFWLTNLRTPFKGEKREESL